MFLYYVSKGNFLLCRLPTRKICIFSIFNGMYSCSVRNESMTICAIIPFCTMSFVKKLASFGSIIAGGECVGFL